MPTPRYDRNDIDSIFDHSKHLLGKYTLAKAFFWTMPQLDLLTAREYWENIKHCVASNNISPACFWRQEENRKFHVRPKGRNAKDLSDNPNGGKVKKYCYWINSRYIEDIVKNEI